jgi:hypothetical protein
MMWAILYLVGLLLHLVAFVTLLIKSYYNREVVWRMGPIGPFETVRPLNVNWLRVIGTILGWPILTLWALGLGYKELFFH